MLRLLLIFPQQLSKTCPLAKKNIILEAKIRKKGNDTRHFPSPQRNRIFPGLMEVKFFFRAFFEHSREIFNNSQARYKKFHSNVQKKLSKKI